MVQQLSDSPTKTPLGAVFMGRMEEVADRRATSDNRMWMMIAYQETTGYKAVGGDDLWAYDLCWFRKFDASLAGTGIAVVEGSTILDLMPDGETATSMPYGVLYETHANPTSVAALQTTFNNIYAKADPPDFITVAIDVNIWNVAPYDAFLAWVLATYPGISTWQTIYLPRWLYHVTQEMDNHIHAEYAPMIVRCP